MIRIATASDASQMASLLNAIIAKGGTTAHQTVFDRDRMVAHYISPPKGIVTHLVELDGAVVGFQSLERADPVLDDMPIDWGVIASFVTSDMAGRGVGKSLFVATKAAAILAGIVTIDATIRADNPGGLGYYDAMGFRDYDRLIAVPLTDGTPVDRVRKRYDL